LLIDIELLKSQWRLKYDHKTHRLRCQGHIINLAARSFLFVTEREFLEELETGGYDITLEEIREWRQRGPLGKLHNLVVHIQGSVQREQRFRELSGDHRLVRDNDTRWNSWFSMISTAINLRDAIDQYCASYPENSIRRDTLSEEDWEVLGEVKGFLEKLSMATKAIESSNSCIDIVIPVMEYILKQFETEKVKHTDQRIFGPMLNSGWSKLKKYYNLMDESHAYTAALVLNPRRKWQWIEKKWPESWVPDARRLVQRVWETEYKPVGSTMPSPPPRTTNDFWLDLDADDIAEAAHIDEYTRYCSAPPVFTDDAIAWWLEDTQQKMYPNLAHMALDYLSIPAMSAEPERLFSSCKITLSDRRNRMGPELVEALQCLKSWLEIKDQEAEIVGGILSRTETSQTGNS